MLSQHLFSFIYRSHGALCACTAMNMKGKLPRILHGGGKLSERARIQCIVKSTFSETRLVPALNDLLIANPSPAAGKSALYCFII